MDKCPMEIWTHIFGLACTDGGFTGCSLALVSRYARRAVLPEQLYSVALRGRPKMAQFLDLLEQRDPAQRRVRHLFLSSGTAGTGSAFSPDTGGNLSTTPHDGGDIMLYRILSTIAPDLLTLTSTLSQRRVSRDSVLCIPFPSLVELTVHGYFLYPNLPYDAKLHDSFPSLQRLHVLSSPDSATLYTSRSPTLTHLKLSAVADMGPPLLQSLLDLLSDPDTARTDVSSPSSPTIQRILLEQSGHMALMMAAVTAASPVNVRLRALREADKDHKFILLKKGNARRDGARQDWEDRITGGLGCWNERCDAHVQNRLRREL